MGFITSLSDLVTKGGISFIFFQVMMAGSLAAQTIDFAQIPNPVTPKGLPPTPPPQDVVPPTEQLPPSSPKPEPLPPPEDLLQPPSSSPANPAPVPGSGAKIRVKRFEVIGNTVFSQQELDKVFARFINQPLSFTDLLRARSLCRCVASRRWRIHRDRRVRRKQFRHLRRVSARKAPAIDRSR